MTDEEESYICTCDYFNGDLTDCKNSHLFRFSVAVCVCRKLAEFEKSEVPVRLSKYEVKPSRQGGQLEIQVGKDKKVQKSEKSFEVKSLNLKIEGGKDDHFGGASTADAIPACNSVSEGNLC